MKYLNYILFAFVLLSFPLQAVADIPSNVRQTRKRVIAIIGHTGQDPVYRSTIGSDPFLKPGLGFIGGTDSFESVSFKSIYSLLVESENWSDEIPSTNELNFSDIPVSVESGLVDLFDDDFVSLNTIPTNSTLPAPPAFIVVLAGILGRTSRKK